MREIKRPGKAALRAEFLACGLLLCLWVPVASHAQAASGDEYSRMDLLDDERVLKIGDRVNYTVVEDRERPQLLFVNDRGEVDVPLVGRVPSAGLTCKQLAFEIKKLLEVDFYYQATVLVNYPLASNSRGEVMILGEVGQQGPLTIPMDEVLTLSGAVLRAGGFSQGADRESVSVLRADADNPEEEITLEADVGKMFDTGRFNDDIVLQPGDLVLVPKLATAGGQFYISGAVVNPRYYDIPPEKDFTVSKAVVLAGGFTQWAKKREVELIRADPDLPPGEKKVVVNVQQVLEEGIRDFDPVVQPGDIIRVKERFINL